MIDDPRYPEGVALFCAGKFFEAHEELELAWRATPPGDTKRFLQGLIQLAVSLEHWRRGNPRGARGQWEKARAKLHDLPEEFEGLALGRLRDSFHAWYAPYDLDQASLAQASGAWSRPEDPRPYPAPEWTTPPPAHAPHPPSASDRDRP